MAALLIASVPLWVILLRAAAAASASRARSVAAVLVGFAGVALLLRPGEQTGGASLLGLLACVGAALMWAGGSFASPRLDSRATRFVSGALADAARRRSLRAAASLAGEVRRRRPRRVQPPLDRRPRLPVVVRLLARVHRLRLAAAERADLKVATYAYVNPVVAIVLGWLILDEAVTTLTLAARRSSSPRSPLVVRTESRRSNPR